MNTPTKHPRTLSHVHALAATCAMGAAFASTAGAQPASPSSSKWNINEKSQIEGSILAGGGGSAKRNCLDPSTGLFLASCRQSAAGKYATISGGRANQASELSVVAGGEANRALNSRSVVSGGQANAALGITSVIGGGEGNSIGGLANSAAIGGGHANHAAGSFAVVSGGANNQVHAPHAAVIGGAHNVAGVNEDNGAFSVILGGRDNSTAGNGALAAGMNARSLHANAFVWGGSPTDATTSNGNGSFTINAPGGIFLASGAPSAGGCTLTGAAGWSCTSDRNTKTNITPLDSLQMLHQVAALPLTRWSYKGTEGVKNIGPMAQDFWRAFGLGDSDRSIASMNMSGVALAAIQGLHNVVKEKDRQIEQLAARLERLEATLETAKTPASRRLESAQRLRMR